MLELVAAIAGCLGASAAVLQVVILIRRDGRDNRKKDE